MIRSDPPSTRRRRCHIAGRHHRLLLVKYSGNRNIDFAIWVVYQSRRMKDDKDAVAFFFPSSFDPPDWMSFKSVWQHSRMDFSYFSLSFFRFREPSLDGLLWRINVFNDYLKHLPQIDFIFGDSCIWRKYFVWLSVTQSNNASIYWS